MRKPFTIFLALLVCGFLVACSAAAQRLEPVASGLRAPVSITNAGDERLFVVEQRGRIQLLVGGELAAEPFLDIRDRVQDGGERGLLGLAFPSDHMATGR